MKIQLLGTAAGGGVPQWNCTCRVCSASRAGRIPSRTQSCAAVSADGEQWFLLNASPDLQAQIESFPPLQPHSTSLRNSPIQGVLLNSADLDHALGILLLREGERLKVHATESMRDSLVALTSPLDRFRGIEWITPPAKVSPLGHGLMYQAIPLGQERVAWRIAAGGRSIVYAPDVANVEEKLLAQMNDCDALFFDGTFWSHDELPNAAGMNHLPITQSIEILKNVKAKRKFYIHINNTNPILLPDSDEARAVADAEIEIPMDGMSIVV